MSRLHALTVLAVALGSCGQGIDAPPPPDLQPVLQAYANPTAVVGSAIMRAPPEGAGVADEIEEAAKEIEGSEIFKEILDVIKDVQEELDDSTAKTCSGGDDDGKACDDDMACPGGTCVATGLVFGATCSGGDDDGSACDVGDDMACPGGGTCGGGVTIPSPTGSIQVNYICPGFDPGQFEDGYDAEPASANGSIDLWMTLDSGGIGRVVWGTAAKCLYLVPIEGNNCEASGCFKSSYDGGVALDLGDTVSAGQDIDQLLVTFVIEGTIGIEGLIGIPCATDADCVAAIGPLPVIVCHTSTNTCDLNGSDTRINQSFRVILADESGLEILVDVADPALSETFNYIFQGTSQSIRDATGVFGCSLEESRCFDESGTLFSW